MLMQADLHARFQMMTCPHNGNIRTHLDTMWAMYEDLASIGMMIDDSKYASIITWSLPKSYQNFITPVTIAAHITGHQISVDSLILYVRQEYNCISSRSKN